MRIYHIPDGINSTSSVVDLSYAASFLGKNARRHPLSVINTKKIIPNAGAHIKCIQCDGLAMEVHHKKPLWASAVEFIMESSPTTTSDVIDLASTNERSDIFGAWHDLSNLVPLCCVCHIYWQVIDDVQWKINLSDRYRLVYSVTWCDALIRKKNKPSLAEYADEYLLKQRTKLEKKLSNPGVHPWRY